MSFLQLFLLGFWGAFLTFALDFTTGAAADGSGFDVAFSSFIPPFLLLSFPDSVFAAIATGKFNVKIIAALYEKGNAVTVVGLQ